MKAMVFSQFLSFIGGAGICLLMALYLSAHGYITMPRPISSVIMKDQEQVKRITCAAGTREVMNAEGNIVSCKTA